MPAYCRLIVFTLFALCLVSNNAFALRESRPLPVDPRMRIVTYDPNDVIKFTGHYEYQSSIVFGDGETIRTISMGTTNSWQIVPSGNRIFLKPIEFDATTNMTVITNKRIYHFELHAREVDPELGINDDQLVFVMTFRYPTEFDTDSGSSSGAVMFFGGNNIEPDLSEPEKYNFNYTVSGSDLITPIRVFDDGEFTYMQFPRKSGEIPAVFHVLSDGTESIVNYRIQGSYLVVERVTSQFTLRSGEEVACIFNETRPLKKTKPN